MTKKLSSGRSSYLTLPAKNRWLIGDCHGRKSYNAVYDSEFTVFDLREPRRGRQNLCGAIRKTPGCLRQKDAGHLGFSLAGKNRPRRRDFTDYGFQRRVV